MTVTGQEITDYVERVRAALADLPPEARDELTEDLPEHLAEVAAEDGGSLVERLGEPEAYAAELRAAAGAGERSAGRLGLEQRFGAAASRARVRLAGLDTRLGPLLGYASASEFLRLLRPAWWVLRGYLAALLLGVLAGGPTALLPRVGDNPLLGLVVLIGCVLASIWLGRRGGELRRWPRFLLQAGTAVLIIFALSLLVSVDQRARWPSEYYDPISVRTPYDEVQDVYVYDSEGRLVENARLFDQNGTPIRLGWPSCTDPALPDVNPVQRGYPYCPADAPFRPRPPAPVPVQPGTVPTTAVPSATATPTAPAPTGAAPAPTGAAPAPTVSAPPPTTGAPAPTATVPAAPTPGPTG
ncbi:MULTISPECIES: HAAS signaling domain-containing protein [unclassified Micromonospora]|uniref:HAAS signaling domain-containing protein n=1 Tax=unclassified Micromonospora TaxID=2617518 RepID=UPI002FF28BE5